VKKNLVLLGMMAVGKTTLGKSVAKKQKLEFIDIDKNIEKKNLMTIKEIFRKKGEKFFRTEEENEVLKSLKKNNVVISLGGGAFINNILRENILKNSISVWLDIDVKVLSKRVAKSKKRPLLNTGNSNKKLNNLYNERKNIYKLAHHKIKCDNLSIQTITNKIVTIYEKY
jgi:shikimate kinase/shikimate kinase/3-dehydroquinate synthase